MRKYEITRKPVVAVCCPKRRNALRCGGALFRQKLSRLEEGLGHEGYACDKCSYAVKYVPAETRSTTVAQEIQS